MNKIRWSNEERNLLLKEVQRQHFMHPTMRTLDLVRMSQRVALEFDRRRELTGTQQVEWVQKERDQWVKDVSVPEVPQTIEPPKPDLMSQLVELLSDAMVQVVAEAIVKARAKLDLPVAAVQHELKSYHKEKPQLTKIAVYGLFSNQAEQVRKHFNGCFEFRFIKDVSQGKLVAAAQWADHFIIMTKFVSHDYNAIKKYGNIIYLDGAASALIEKLETMYVEQTS